MADDTTQRAAFALLREHLQSQEPFTIDEFIAATGWDKPGTLNTYLRKQYKGLIEKVDDTHFRVTDAFWKFVTWRKFKGHVTQVRRVVSNYEPKSSKVLIYDFLMPLIEFPVLRVAQIRQRKPVTENAIFRNENEAPPDVVATKRWRRKRLPSKSRKIAKKPAAPGHARAS